MPTSSVYMNITVTIVTQKRSICIKHRELRCTLHVSLRWRKLASVHVTYHFLLQRWSPRQLLHYVHTCSLIDNNNSQHDNVNQHY